MKRIDLKIGFLCNNHCQFCVQGDKRYHFGNRPISQLKTFLRESRPEAEGVVLTGGEPTLHQDFLELVSYAKKLDFKVIQIQTNGRMFAYKSFCQKTIEAEATEFSPALHGPNAKIHDFLTTVPDSFAQTSQAIKNLKELGQKVMTNTVITTANYKYLPAIAKLLVNLGVDQFQFAFVHISGTAAENQDWIVPKKSQIMPYVKKGLSIGLKANCRVMAEAIPLCMMKGYEDYIAEKIIPMAKVFDAEYIIDDYTKYRQTQGKAKGPNCSKCKYFKICEGPWREYPKLFGWSEFKPVK